MRRRGLGDPLLVVCDGAPGLTRAIEECFPRSLRQRCLVHKLRNLQSKVPEDQWPEFKARAIACYQAASPALARLLRDDIVASYGAALPSALACLQDDFEACIAHLRFPLAHWWCDPHHQPARAAVRRGAATHQGHPARVRRARVLKLMYAALIRAAEHWRGLRMTEFEHRQLTALRNELDRAHAERTALVVRANVTASPARLSSKSRT